MFCGSLLTVPRTRQIGFLARMQRDLRKRRACETSGDMVHESFRVTNHERWRVAPAGSARARPLSAPHTSISDARDEAGNRHGKGVPPPCPGSILSKGIKAQAGVKARGSRASSSTARPRRPGSAAGSSPLGSLTRRRPSRSKKAAISTSTKTSTPAPTNQNASITSKKKTKSLLPVRQAVAGVQSGNLEKTMGSGEGHEFRKQCEYSHTHSRVRLRLEAVELCRAGGDTAIAKRSEYRSDTV